MKPILTVFAIGLVWLMHLPLLADHHNPLQMQCSGCCCMMNCQVDLKQCKVLAACECCDVHYAVPLSCYACPPPIAPPMCIQTAVPPVESVTVVPTSVIAQPDSTQAATIPGLRGRIWQRNNPNYFGDNATGSGNRIVNIFGRQIVEIHGERMDGYLVGNPTYDRTNTQTQSEPKRKGLFRRR